MNNMMRVMIAFQFFDPHCVTCYKESIDYILYDIPTGHSQYIKTQDVGIITCLLLNYN